MALFQVPSARADDQRRHLFVEAILLSLRAREGEGPLDGVDQVDLALDQVRPRGRVRILEVGHEHAGPGIERIDQHLAIGRACDLDPPVLEILRRRRDTPLGFSDRPGRAQEIGHLSPIDARLALIACLQQLLATWTELALQATNEVESLGRQHLARAPDDRALDLYLLSCRHPEPMLSPGQALHHGRKRLCDLARQDHVRDPIALAPLAQRLHYLVDGADEEMRRVEYVSGLSAKASSYGSRQRNPVVGDGGEEDRDAQLDVVDPITYCFLYPCELFIGGAGEARADQRRVDSTLAQVVVHVHDIGLARRQAQHAAAAASQQDGWMRLLHW